DGVRGRDDDDGGRGDGGPVREAGRRGGVSEPGPDLVRDGVGGRGHAAGGRALGRGAPGDDPAAGGRGGATGIGRRPAEVPGVLSTQYRVLSQNLALRSAEGTLTPHRTHCWSSILLSTQCGRCPSDRQRRRRSSILCTGYSVLSTAKPPRPRA